MVNCTFCSDALPLSELRVGQGVAGTEYACDICILEGYIYVCDKCGKFEHVDEFTGPIAYGEFCCYDCRDPTIFQFKVGINNPVIFKIPLPKDRENSITTNYFYEELSAKLNIPMNRIYIKQIPVNLWFVGNHYDNPRDKIFDVIIYNCNCGQCCQCDYIKRNANNMEPYGVWLWQRRDDIKRNDYPSNWR